MAKFFAVTSIGLAEVLENEIKSLGLTVLERENLGVHFEANWEGCYRANLYLRTATRVLKPILDFPAYEPQELYHNTLKHDFTKYINPDQTIAVDASVRESSFRDQRFVALKIKDAIVDQFREKFDVRPNVDAKNPDLQIMARVVKNQVSLALDTSGDSLSLRGYRREAGDAPLREHLAAGIVDLSGWDGQQPLVDPMCGSGTILIEAALKLRNISPGSLRKRFAFQKWKTFQPEAWDKVVTEALSSEVATHGVHFYGFDKDARVIKMARANAERAGVDGDITFQQARIDTLKAPVESGLVIVNPPYGERLGVTEELKDVYRDMSYGWKKEFKGWTCWLLSGNPELTMALKMKASRKHRVFNGNIECRFLEYKIT